MTEVTETMIAIGLLILANVLITIARGRDRGWLRLLLSVVAFFMLFPALLFAVKGLGLI